MTEKIIVSESELEEILERVADDILNEDIDDLILVGIQRRGADISARLARKLVERGFHIPSASLDINLYRDDWTALADGIPRVGPSSLPQNITGKNILLIDDVLFTGRTIRSALDALLDYGRPAKVSLFALIDRGHRELPICANYIGLRIETKRSQQVDVLLKERDGRDGVIIRE